MYVCDNEFEPDCGTTFFLGEPMDEPVCPGCGHTVFSETEEVADPRIHSYSSYQAAIQDIARILLTLPQSEREQATTVALGDVAGWCREAEQQRLLRDAYEYGLKHPGVYPDDLTERLRETIKAEVSDGRLGPSSSIGAVARSAGGATRSAKRIAGPADYRASLGP
jgi:hypothetical protein